MLSKRSQPFTSHPMIRGNNQLTRNRISLFITPVEVERRLAVERHLCFAPPARKVGISVKSPELTSLTVTYREPRFPGVTACFQRTPGMISRRRLQTFSAPLTSQAGYHSGDVSL